MTAIRAEGGEILELTRDEHNAFVAAVTPIYGEARRQFSPRGPGTPQCVTGASRSFADGRGSSARSVVSMSAAGACLFAAATLFSASRPAGAQSELAAVARQPPGHPRRGGADSRPAAAAHQHAEVCGEPPHQEFLDQGRSGRVRACRRAPPFR